MKERLTMGVIVIFLALAVQDGFFGSSAEPSTNAVPGSALVIGADSHSARSHETRVVRIVDGDTIVVLINGVQEKIRLIGVDTPEIFDPRGSAQCFGEEARAFTKSLLENKAIRLEADVSQDDRDKYGRLLRYVFLKDGTFVNSKIITQGYGHEYTYRRPYKHQAEFKNAELSARTAKKGLWAPDACGVENII